MQDNVQGTRCRTGVKKARRADGAKRKVEEGEKEEEGDERRRRGSSGGRERQETDQSLLES